MVDGNSQLASFDAQGASGSYVYDGLLRRVEKTADGVTTLYARDAVGNVVASLTGGVWTDYIWDDPVGVGNRLEAAPAAAAAERIAAVVGAGNGTVYYFHTDQVGTTRVLTDANGNNQASCGQNPTYPNGSLLTYGPFGLPTGCTQSATPILFTGHELDSESNLSQFQYRKYAALEGRWATPDPAGKSMGRRRPHPTASIWAWRRRDRRRGSNPGRRWRTLRRCRGSACRWVQYGPLIRRRGTRTRTPAATPPCLSTRTAEAGADGVAGFR